MKVTAIRIYGFGKWIDAEWNLNDEGLTVLYGYNEAGKSTLMAFIQFVLFGFSKSKNEHYQPKESDKFGGSLSLAENGRVTVIERTGGRTSKGNVTVYLPDGTAAGEEHLQLLLNGLDEHTFKGIFHFGLDGLYGLKDLSPKALNRLLYDAAMTGADRLTELEKSLVRQSEKIFKPRGQKTEANALANELTVLKSRMAEWEQRIGRYDELNSLNKINKEKLNNLNKEQVSLQNEIRKRDKQATLEPLVSEWHVLNQDTKGEDSPVFPQDGIRRFEILNDKLKTKESERVYECKAEEKLKAELNDCPSDMLSQEQKKEIASLLQYEPVYQKLAEDKDQINDVFKRSRYAQEELENQWELTEKDFQKINLTPYLIKSFEKIKSDWQSVYSREDYLEEEKRKVAREERLTKEQLETESAQLLSEDKEQQLKRLSDTESERVGLEERKLTLEENLNRLNNEKDRSVNREKRQFFQWTAVSAASVFAAGILAVNGNIPAAAAVLAITVLSAVFAVISKNKTKHTIASFGEEENVLTDKLKSVNDQLRESETNDREEVLYLLAMNDDRKKRMSAFTQQLEMLVKQQSALARDMEKLEEDKQELAGQLSSWCSETGLPADKDIFFYNQFLEAARLWKRHEKEKEDAGHKRNELIRKMKDYEKSLIAAAQRANIVRNGDEASETAEALSHFMQEQSELEEKKSKLNEKLDTKKEVLHRIEQEETELRVRINDLFSMAEAENEEDFRQKAEKHARHEKKTMRINDLFLQISTIVPDKQEREAYISAILRTEDEKTDFLQSPEGRLEEIEDEKNKLITDVSRTTAEIREIEENGTYNELRQQFSILKTRLEDKTKEWAVFQTGLYMIDKVKEIYEKERQPEVIKEAEIVFSRLTDGTYISLFAPLGEERFIVERHDGHRFDPSELSRGTAELLYFSLRLGLASGGGSAGGAPLFMDETFVNMDTERRKRVIKLLAGLAEERQIILFTCHDHIRDEVSDAAHKANVIAL